MSDKKKKVNETVETVAVEDSTAEKINESVAENQKDSVQAQKTEKKKKKWWLIILIILLVMVIDELLILVLDTDETGKSRDELELSG